MFSISRLPAPSQEKQKRGQRMEPFKHESGEYASAECELNIVLPIGDVNDMIDLVQEIECCTRKAKLMTKDLFEDYLIRTSYTESTLMYYRQDAATRGDIAYSELIKASELMNKLISWFDTILGDIPESRLN